MDINLENKTPDIRFLNDIKEVVYDKEWLKTADNLELYYMYRGLETKDDLRYDITVIPSKILGNEFVKTKGHEHIGRYGEVYIVLEGEAIYLIQKRENNEIKDAYAVKAKKGDVVIIPSFYGHITINPSNNELKMANWVSKNCKSDYQPYLEKQGGCYFYTKDGWIKNKNYSKVPDLHFKEPQKYLPKDLNFLNG
ncbi:MAG: glucose-6-phosphate isomerase family protein [Candidatus Nealsonbacteria bacterium]